MGGIVISVYGVLGQWLLVLGWRLKFDLGIFNPDMNLVERRRLRLFGLMRKRMLRKRMVES